VTLLEGLGQRRRHTLATHGDHAGDTTRRRDQPSQALASLHERRVEQVDSADLQQVEEERPQHGGAAHRVLERLGATVGPQRQRLPVQHELVSVEAAGASSSPQAAAIACVRTPSSAPWRSSPRSTPRR
jgi:hypothetical protein